jgi:phosphatidylglycerol:prolipoprotein diacylglycerol transferase
MFPVLLKIGPMVIYTYGFALTLATIVASFLIWRRSRKLGFYDEHIIDMVLFSLFFALVFARAGYIFANPEQFSSVLRILLVTYFPGLDGAFGLLGGVCGFFMYSMMRKWKLLPLFDCVVVGLSLGIAIVMMGAFFAGSYIGTPTNAYWGVLLPGYSELRHPIALYYAVTGFMLYVLLILLDRKKRTDGILSSIFFLTFGVALIGFDWYTVGGLALGGVHLTQGIGVLGVILGIYILYRVKRTPRTPSSPLSTQNTYTVPSTY